MPTTLAKTRWRDALYGRRGGCPPLPLRREEGAGASGSDDDSFDASASTVGLLRGREGRWVPTPTPLHWNNCRNVDSEADVIQRTHAHADACPVCQLSAFAHTSSTAFAHTSSTASSVVPYPPLKPEPVRQSPPGGGSSSSTSSSRSIASARRSTAPACPNKSGNTLGSNMHAWARRRWGGTGAADGWGRLRKHASSVVRYPPLNPEPVRQSPPGGGSSSSTSSSPSSSAASSARPLTMPARPRSSHNTQGNTICARRRRGCGETGTADAGGIITARKLVCSYESTGLTSSATGRHDHVGDHRNVCDDDVRGWETAATISSQGYTRHLTLDGEYPGPRRSNQDEMGTDARKGRNGGNTSFNSIESSLALLPPLTDEIEGD
ncbi:hypothetical protein B0H34DRAFT_860569 [Crassisporium funariophilum]|nr:hypothetical protein B0H34DRAFT_860569 [Crassisporium funariophilum]